MANYDASVVVHGDVDNSKLKETEKEIKNVGEAVGQEVEKAGKKIEQQQSTWERLTQQAEEYKSRLKDLISEGADPGNKAYDEAYIGWQNAEYALKQYENSVKEHLAELDQQTVAGKELADIQAKAVINNRDLVALLRQQEAITERMSLLRQAGVGEGYQEYDTLAAKLKYINKEIERQRSGFTKAESAGKKCFAAISRSAKQSMGILGEVAKRISKLVIGILILNQIRKAFNAMVSAAKEGFKNLAQYSNNYNQQMSALKSSLAQTKNALAAAFEPVVNTVIPYLTQMVSWLNIAIDKVGQFLAAIGGSSTYTRAKKQTIDYAKSLDTASKAAKGALASFDELNVLSQNKSDSGAGAGGELAGAAAFETAPIENQVMESLDRIKELLQPFSDDISDWWGSLDFEPLFESLDHLKEACEPFAGYLYDGMKFFLDEILEPLSTWAIEEGLPTFLDMVSNGLKFLSTVIDAASPGLSYIWEHVLKPMGEYTGEVFIWALNLISDAFKKMAELVSSKSEEINTILEAIGKLLELIWVRDIKPTLDFIMGATGELVDYIINIAGDLIDILAGIIEFLTGVFTGDWEKAWQGLVKIFKGIVNGIIDIFEGVVNSIISGINNISIDVPDWVLGFGGQHFGFDLEKLHLPRLAEGAVIPGGKPFMAMLGDQIPGQTNIETPVETMKEAIRDVMDEFEGGDINVTMELDGEVIYRDVIHRQRRDAKSSQ